MPHLTISRETADTLARAARARGCTVDDLIIALAAASDDAIRDHPLIAYTLSPEFRVKFTDADRFLALLAWVASQHGPEFSDFVSHLESRRRYVGLSAEEIRETCRHNQARQIPGTHFWAIMNLDTPTKQRFLRRLLVFVGLPDEVIEAAVSTVGGRPAGSRSPA